MKIVKNITKRRLGEAASNLGREPKEILVAIDELGIEFAHRNSHQLEQYELDSIRDHLNRKDTAKE